MKKALFLCFSALVFFSSINAHAKKEVKPTQPAISPEEAESKRLYLKGRALFSGNSEKKDPAVYKQACMLFEQAYAFKAHAWLLYNIAVCAEKLTDWHKALRAYEATLAHEPPPDDATMLEVGKALPRVRRLASISGPEPPQNPLTMIWPHPVVAKPEPPKPLEKKPDKPDSGTIVKPVPKPRVDAGAYFRSHKKSLLIGGASLALAITAASLIGTGLDQRSDISTRYDACGRTCDLQAEANQAGRLTWAGIGIGIGAVLAAGTSIIFGILERRQLRLQPPTISLTSTGGSISMGFTF